MKTLIKLVGLILFCTIPFFTEAQTQIVYPSNSTFDYPDDISGTGVPNHIAPPFWNRVNPNTTPDVSKLGITNYGFFLSPEFNSANGGHWLRSIDLPIWDNGSRWQEGVYTTVSGLVVGRQYQIKFEQAIVAGQINQNGFWQVSLENQTMNAPLMIAPSTPYSMSPWQNVSIGPFTATSTSMIIKVEAVAQNQIVFNQWDGCDLALDAIYLEGFNSAPNLDNESVEICEESNNNLLVIDLKATDPDGDKLKYSIISGNIGNTFSINDNNGKIIVQDATQLDPDITSTYNLVVEVDDEYGGKDQGTITININQTPEFTTVKTDITCSTPGGIVITPTVGVSPFQYSIDGGISFQSSDTYNNLPAGEYTVMVKDAKTCMGSSIVTINTIAPFTVNNISTTKETCNTGGTVTFNVSGGTPDIEYSINNGVDFQKVNTFEDLPAGTYKVIIKDGSGCIVDQNISIEAFPTIEIIDIETNDITCSKGGSIHITATTPGLPIQYSINGGSDWETDSFFIGLAASTYNISVKDANGCTDTQKDTIYSIPSFTVDSINTTNETCGSGGSISIYTHGGTDPLEYSINNGITFQSGNTFSGLAGGPYNIVVKDANGCNFNQTVTVNTTPPFTLDGIVTDVTCAGLGTITVLISSPTATMEYSVDGGLTFQDSNFFDGLIANDYDIVVRDFNSCTKTQTVTVKNIPPFTVDSVVSKNATCFSNGNIHLFTSGGTDPIEYSIDGGLNFFSKDTFNNLPPGSYDIVIKDGNTCNYSETRIIAPAIPANIDSIIIQNDSCNACQGEINIFATGSGSLDYSIDNGGSTQKSNKFTGLCAGNYKVLITTGTCSTPKKM